MARKQRHKYCYRVQTLTGMLPLMFTDNLDKAIRAAAGRKVPCRVLANVSGEEILTTGGK